MNRVVEPVSPGDDLDALLTAFYKAEVPAPWPDFRPPVKARLVPAPTAAGAGPAWASRLALAAALALLLALSGLLPRPAGTSGDQGTGPISTFGPHTAGPLPPGPASGAVELTPDRVKSSLHLEQRNDGSTNIKITVEELPSSK